MRTTIEAFWLPKGGNAPEEYEDAFWPAEPSSCDAPIVRLAVADGATESSFSGAWARLLTSAFGSGKFDDQPLEAGLAPLQNQWRTEVGTKPLPWYAEEKLRDGAFSTLLGLRLMEGRDPGAASGAWEAVAVGDSCLFQVRGPQLVRTFPLEKASEFDSRPVLLSSVSASNKGLQEAVRRADGTWNVGDTFYLVTDALACWFLRRWESLSEFDDPADFLDLLGKLANGHEFETRIAIERGEIAKDGIPMLKNDDITLVRCTIAASSAGGDDDALADRG